MNPACCGARTAKPRNFHLVAKTIHTHGNCFRTGLSLEGDNLDPGNIEKWVRLLGGVMVIPPLAAVLWGLWRGSHRTLGQVAGLMDLHF